MSLPISQIVDVQISRDTAAPAQATFSVPLILGEHALFAERVKFVSDLTGLTSLGFTTSDPEYQLAQKLFGQTPKPSKLAIGRREANVARVMTITLSGSLVTGNTVSVEVNGDTVSAPFNTDDATTLSDFAAALLAHAAVASATVAGSVVTVTFELGIDGLLASALVTGGASQVTATIATSVAGKTVASELDLLVVESEDFYAILLDSALENDVMSGAAWAQAHTPAKILATRTTDAAALTGASTDVGSKLKAKNLSRTFVSFANGGTDFLDAAILGRMLPEDPGTATFKFKQVAGVPFANVNQGQASSLRGKNINFYASVAGVGIFTEGVMANGEFIDNVIGTDWLQARLAERIFGRLASSKKIPFTDGGIATIESAIRAQLDEAVGRGFITDDYTVTVPLAASVSTSAKAARELPDVTFEATLAGAIHSVKIRGAVKL